MSRSLVVLSLLVAYTGSGSAFLPSPRVSLTLQRDYSVEEDNVQWVDDEPSTPQAPPDDGDTPRGRARWENLNPRVKQRLIRIGQERAIANKAKQTNKHDRRRRQLVFVKQTQRQRQRDARVQRAIPFDERTPIADLPVGTKTTGQVISLTPYGAYVDVGSEVDGLLHISQITRQEFIEHPRQCFTPGDEVSVYIKSTNPDLKKIHLTMLEGDSPQYQNASPDGLALDQLQVDDELWGILKRVTDYGAFVEVGAQVDGFLHFMDHPDWDGAASPRDFMERETRVRVWVSDVNLAQNRLKLTGHRPGHLPGPRREIRW